MSVQTFFAQKTMHGGKLIASGDTVFIFASENAGGEGLVARAVVRTATAVPPNPALERQTHGSTSRLSAAPLPAGGSVEQNCGRSSNGTTAEPRPKSTSSSIARPPT
ncbi:MAG: hypothetical protein ABIN96_17955, partial [Rubrivivax sp.]